MNKINKYYTIILLLCFVIPVACVGCGADEYNYENVGVAVSKRTTAYLQGDKLDLTSELDPAQVPDIIKASYLEAAELKKSGKDLVKFVIQDVSNKIAEISTIDLNQDEVPDPILIVPEGNDESMTFSIRVPDPSKVKVYPDQPDEWQKIAEESSIEVLSVTVFPRAKSNNKDVSFDVEARPNSQVYENHHHHHYQSSFLHTYFTYRMMTGMFFNPYYGGWYGPRFYGGFGYYGSGYYNRNYGGRSVGTVRSTRRTYNRSKASTAPMKTSSGKSVSSKMSSQKSKGVSSFKSSAIKKRNATNAKKASGFGSRKSSSSSRSSGFGRSSSRSSHSSRGSRGFGK